MDTRIDSSTITFLIPPVRIVHTLLTMHAQFLQRASSRIRSHKGQTKPSIYFSLHMSDLGRPCLRGQASGKSRKCLNDLSTSTSVCLHQSGIQTYSPVPCTVHYSAHACLQIWAAKAAEPAVTLASSKNCVFSVNVTDAAWFIPRTQFGIIIILKV